MVEEQGSFEQIKDLKKELEFYKGLISELPFSFSYRDPKNGLMFSKDRRDSGGKIQVYSGQEKERIFNYSSATIPFDEIELFLNPILDLVPHHIVFINSKGMITLCNLQAARDLNVERETIIGKHIRDLLNIPDDQINVLETLKTEEPIINREVLDKNYGINNTRIIRNPDGSIERVMGAFQFLNGVKEAEKQALAGRIAAGIAHEIRNPLTTVRGYLQLLQSRVDTETANLFSTLLIPEVDRANKIISDFLRIAKPSQTTEEKIQISEFIHDYLGNFLNSEALLHNIEIKYEIEKSTEDCFFVGDREELFQVFINLYRNSLQAKSNQPLVIKIKTQLLGNKVRITFSDNGKGINPSILNHVFDPFFTTKDEGTGLGLSVSKKIVENHKGSMYASSNSIGTSFYIELPVNCKP